MRAAVVDLGTNTFHLLIAEMSDGTVTTLLKELYDVKLGEGGINKGYIAEAAYQRGLAAMDEIAQNIQKYEAQEVKAIATSAIRGAANGEEFMREVKEKTGIAIQTFNGLEEAEHIFTGVSQSVDFGHEDFLVMDIGGGSVEFIIGNNSTISWKQSFEIGCARLMALFHREDPIPEREIVALEEYLSEQLDPLIKAASGINKLVGSAGSFESIVELLEEEKYRDLNKINETAVQIKINDFHYICWKLIRSKSEERRQMKGLVGYRVDMIVSAAILIRFVLNNLGIKELYCSDNALKEGILYRMLLCNSPKK